MSTTTTDENEIKNEVSFKEENAKYKPLKEALVNLIESGTKEDKAAKEVVMVIEDRYARTEFMPFSDITIEKGITIIISKEGIPLQNMENRDQNGEKPAIQRHLVALQRKVLGDSPVSHLDNDLVLAVIELPDTITKFDLTKGEGDTKPKLSVTGYSERESFENIDGKRVSKGMRQVKFTEHPVDIRVLDASFDDPEIVAEIIAATDIKFKKYLLDTFGVQSIDDEKFKDKIAEKLEIFSKQSKKSKDNAETYQHIVQSLEN